MAETMLIVTQVAPYVDGPAGVHGTLPQAAVGSGRTGRPGRPGARARDGRARPVAGPARGGPGPRPVHHRRDALVGRAEGRPWPRRWRAGRLRVLGVHSATDASHTWPEYGALLGARFDGHPWTQDFAIDVVDAGTRRRRISASSGTGATRSTCSVTCDPRPGSCCGWRRTRSTFRCPSGRVPECGFPLAWCIEDGAARSFYTALGHFPLAWELPVYLRHLAGGLAWLEESA